MGSGGWIIFVTVAVAPAPMAMAESFPEDIWIVRSRKIYNTSILLEKLPSLISVNSFGQVLHLVTEKGAHTPDSIELFLSQGNGETICVEPTTASVEDVFMLLMKNNKVVPS